MSAAARARAPPASPSATSQFAALASSNVSSVSVPAVTSRTIARLTGALPPPRFFACSGVSVCSAIATRWPALISRAR